MATRQNRQRETRLLAEYLAEHVHPLPYRQNQPLGAPPPEAVALLGAGKAVSASRPWRMVVDAVAWSDSELFLIEAKILKLVDGLAKLPFYAALVDDTPELQGLTGRRVRMQLVTPWTSEQLERMAAQAEIEVVVFRPDWIAEYVEELQSYWTADARRQREERLRLRKVFGVE